MLRKKMFITSAPVLPNLLSVTHLGTLNTLFVLMMFEKILQ